MAGVGGVRGDMDRAVFLRFPGGDTGKTPGDGVVRRAAGEQVHGDGGKLQRGAALQQQDLMAVGDLQQFSEGGLGGVEDLLKGGGAMAHLHDGHAAAPIVQHLAGCALQHALRQDGGSRGEVENLFSVHAKAFFPRSSFHLILSFSRGGVKR